MNALQRIPSWYRYKHTYIHYQNISLLLFSFVLCHIVYMEYYNKEMIIYICIFLILFSLIESVLTNEIIFKKITNTN